MDVSKSAGNDETRPVTVMLPTHLLGGIVATRLENCLVISSPQGWFATGSRELRTSESEKPSLRGDWRRYQRTRVYAPEASLHAVNQLSRVF